MDQLEGSGGQPFDNCYEEVGSNPINRQATQVSEDLLLIVELLKPYLLN